MEIKDYLKDYDAPELKNFHLLDLNKIFKDIHEEDKSKPEFVYECLACGLSMVSEESKVHFVPTLVWQDPNGNGIRTTADISKIDKNTINYWNERFIESNNPLLKSQYGCLIWDFGPSFGFKKDPELYDNLRQCLKKTIIGDYISNPIELFTYIKKFVEVSSRKPEDKKEAGTLYKDFISKYNKDKYAFYWSSYFDFAITHKDFLEEGELENIIKEHEERLQRLTNASVERLNPWLIKDQAFILAEYYKKIGDKENVKRLIYTMKEAFAKYKDKISPLSYIGNLKIIYSLMIRYELHQEAKALTKDIQDLSVPIMQNLESLETAINISQEALDDISKTYGNSEVSTQEKFKIFVESFLPNKDYLTQQLDDIMSKYPMEGMFAIQLLDPKGRLSSVIDQYEKDPLGRLLYYMGQYVSYTRIYRDLAIKKLGESEVNFTREIVEIHLSKCPLFEKDRLEVIGMIIEKYLQKEYFIFCHLIVPQIENALLNLAAMTDESILKPQKKNKGFQLKTLDDILQLEGVKKALGENGAFYLRVCLTDQRALNIRNGLCHGIFPPKDFNESISNILLHILLFIGSIRLID